MSAEEQPVLRNTQVQVEANQKKKRQKSLPKIFNYFKI
jgi:hypothetical protein